MKGGELLAAMGKAGKEEPDGKQTTGDTARIQGAGKEKGKGGGRDEVP